VHRVKKEREATKEKIRRMAKAYIDGVFPDGEYNRQRCLLEMELESLVVPAANAAEEAGKLILDLSKLWAEANTEERRRLLLSVLDAVYFDTKATKSIVAVRPKPPFKPIFQVAASKEGSGIRIINEPYLGSSVFLVEAGESRTIRETTMRWLPSAVHEFACLLRVQHVSRFGFGKQDGDRDISYRSRSVDGGRSINKLT
jgi:site-specific DNA recombinase